MRVEHLGRRVQPCPRRPPAAAAPAQKNATPGAADPDASRANVIQALQRFAAVVPVLVQLVVASGKGGKEFGLAEDGSNRRELTVSKAPGVCHDRETAQTIVGILAQRLEPDQRH
jgi:hypothetical protein